MKKKTKIVLMSVGGVLFVGAVIFLIWYVNDRQKQIAEEEAAAAENNCCNEADWGTCVTEADWQAGYVACQKQGCQKCKRDEVINPSFCGNGKCQAGESYNNCPEDCTEAGDSTNNVTDDGDTTGGTWNQCDDTRSNAPCGSCSMRSVKSDGTMSFQCELYCGDNTCPAPSATITHRWEWCGNVSSNNKDNACNESDADYIQSGNLGGSGPWTISAGEVDKWGYGTYYVPDCGRVQVDVQIVGVPNPAGQVITFGEDCDGTGDATPTVTPTVTPSCTITSNAVCLDEDTINVQWNTVLKNTKFNTTNDKVKIIVNNYYEPGTVGTTQGPIAIKEENVLNGSLNIDITADRKYEIDTLFLDSGTNLCESNSQTIECLSTTSSCSESCTTNDDCANGLVCSTGMCRNSSCLSETDCICPPPPATCNLDCEVDTDCEDGLICSNDMCREEECTDETDCLCDVDITPSGSVPQTGLFDTTKSRLTLGFVFIFVGISLVLLDQFGILQIRTDLKTEKVREKFEKKLK